MCEGGGRKEGGGTRTALSRKFCWAGVKGRRRLGGLSGCCGFGGEIGGVVVVDARRRGFWRVGTRNSNRGD